METNNVVDVEKLIKVDICDNIRDILKNMQMLESIALLKLGAGLLTEEEHDNIYAKNTDFEARVSELLTFGVI